MKNFPKWANPDEFTLAMRCTTVKYANKFIEEGSIKFNTPDSWVKYAITNGEGRGDCFEGTVGMCHWLNILKIKEISEKYRRYSNLTTSIIGDRIYFKNNYSMQLPCFCIYIMKNNMFECPGKEGEYILKTDILGRYFKDFMDNKSKEEVNSLKDEDKPAVILITDFDKFKKRVIKALLDLGLDESEIIFSSVTYFDFDFYGKDGWWDFGQKFPNELTIKHKRFENQSEARIILNTDKKEIKEYLYANAIELGAMDDIATVVEGYFSEGIAVNLKAHIMKK